MSKGMSGRPTEPFIRSWFDRLTTSGMQSEGQLGLPSKWHGRDLDLPEKPVVFVMRPNPEPHYIARVQDPKGRIV